VSSYDTRTERGFEESDYDGYVYDLTVDGTHNFAAGIGNIVVHNTHVDRSILDPDVFVHTNLLGLNSLLRAARDAGVKRFHQVSTDEIYGHVGEGASTEDAPLKPRNPYSASKAGGDLLAFSYQTNFGLPVLVTRGANTIGPYQYPEKATPLFITNALDDLPLPVYGEGKALRHYLYVDDHAAAIDLVLRRGTPGEAYNVGSLDEVNTVQLATRILDLLGKPHSLIRFVPDRPAHDYRYRLDSAKLMQLGWRQRYDWDATIAATVDWYAQHPDWWRPLKSEEFRRVREHIEDAHRAAQTSASNIGR
jgi:dTDP-glucose 4,6-dehydratase